LPWKRISTQFGRLVPKTAVSGNSWPTLEKNGRLWKKGADSGNSWPTLAIRTVCVFPSGMVRPRFSRRFETRLARSRGVQYNESRPVFTAFRDPFSSVWGGGVRNADRRSATHFLGREMCPDGCAIDRRAGCGWG
jgi:hypothetical protein